MASTKCKILTKHFRIPVKTLTAILTEEIVLEMDYARVVGEWVKPAESKKATKIRSHLDHILDVFKCQNLEIVFTIRSNECIDFEYIQKTFQGLDISGIRIFGCSPKRNLDVLNEYPMVKNLVLVGNKLTVNEFREVWRKKLTRLSLCGGFTITFEELLTCKASNLEIPEVNFPGGVINKFLKGWIKGYNPDMESLIFKSSSWEFSLQKVFEGIPYVKAPADLKRKFNKEVSGLPGAHFKGGYDIERRDGTMATLLCEKMPASVKLIFLVWK